MNFYQPSPRYIIGQGNEYTNMRLRNSENPSSNKENLSTGPSNEKLPQIQTESPPHSAITSVVEPKPNDTKSSELQRLVQQLYMAQAQVQLEATEIQRAQTIASTAQKRLEEASNNVRVITTALRSAQEAVASTAQRAQTAQLQLAAHDQLLFTARQKVDAMSAQLVGLQAEVGIAGDSAAVNVPALLEKLKQPLNPDEQPKPPVTLVNNNLPNNNNNAAGSAFVGNAYQTHSAKTDADNWNDYKQYVINQQKNRELPHKLKRSYFNESRDIENMITNANLQSLLQWIHEENRKETLRGQK